MEPNEFRASDRVASSRYRPEAPTDPYVLALEHTVLQITGSLRACKPNARFTSHPPFPGFAWRKRASVRHAEASFRTKVVNSDGCWFEKGIAWEPE
jgi:hypothetical protein